MAIEGMRPCTELKPCPPLTKYAVVLEEQPIPESFTTFCGSSARPQHASTMAAVIESCPDPGPSVERAPPASRRVKPRVFFGSEGCATLGLAMKVMAALSRQ